MRVPYFSDWSIPAKKINIGNRLKNYKRALYGTDSGKPTKKLTQTQT
jgi:hypothetical protein